MKTYKKLIIPFTFGLVFLFTACPKQQDTISEQYTITGTIVKSCNNPTPLSNFQLVLNYACGCTSAKVLQTVYTDINGNFSFSYSSVASNSLVIQGDNGTVFIDYLAGIPINRNLNIGTIHSDSNFCSIIKINPQRQTSIMDTIYYRKYGNTYLKYMVGPYSSNQVLDSFFYFGFEFYDVNNTKIYNYMPGYEYDWKLGNSGNVNKCTLNPQPCNKLYEYIITLNWRIFYNNIKYNNFILK